MDQHCSDTYNISRLTNTGERVPEQGFAKPFSVLAFVHCQTRK